MRKHTSVASGNRMGLANLLAYEFSSSQAGPAAVAIMALAFVASAFLSRRKRLEASTTA